MAALPPDWGALDAPPSYESETLAALNDQNKVLEQQRAKPAWFLAGLPTGCYQGSFRANFSEEFLTRTPPLLPSL